MQIGTVTTKKVKPNIGGGFNVDDVMYYWQALGRCSTTYLSDEPIEQLDLSKLKIQLFDISSLFSEESCFITNKIIYKDSNFLLDDFISWGFQHAEAGWMIKKEQKRFELERILLWKFKTTSNNLSKPLK